MVTFGIAWDNFQNTVLMSYLIGAAITPGQLIDTMYDFSDNETLISEYRSIVDILFEYKIGLRGITFSAIIQSQHVMQYE